MHCKKTLTDFFLAHLKALSNQPSSLSDMERFVTNLKVLDFASLNYLLYFAVNIHIPV